VRDGEYVRKFADFLKRRKGTIRSKFPIDFAHSTYDY